MLILALMAVVAPLDVNTPQPIAHASASAGALFLHKVSDAILNDQTNSISVGVDLAGGMHAAFVNFSADPNGNYHAYYDFCAPGLDCANAANWTLVTLLTVPSSTTIMDATQLALDPQGHPRLVILTSDTGGSFQDHYQYASCDSGCTSSSNWTISDVVDVTLNSTFIYNGNKHFFALDPQGRPRFVADDGSNYVYAFCNSACANAANWNTLSLNGLSATGSGYNTAALAFNAAGQPRLLAPLTDQTTFRTDLTYWECNASDCGTNANSWTSIPLITPMGASAAAYSSLRLTSTGQPRFAYYGTPNSLAETLYYYWCNSACTDNANWSFSNIGLAPAASFYTSGQQPDLALDGQDRPRLSFQTLDNVLGSGLGFARCNTSCQSGSANWQKLLADSNAQLNADWNRLPTFGCSYSSWIGGYRSALVLDASGNSRIGHDVGHFSGLCIDPRFNGEDYKTVRFVYFPGGFTNQVYLPLVVK